MKVRDSMRKQPVICMADTTVAAALELLTTNRCGSLPVVGEGGNVIGMVTDRDIRAALGTRDVRPSQIPVWDAMQHSLFTCAPDDEVHCALKTMRRQKISRLPVVDRQGLLQGILCMEDIAVPEPIRRSAAA